MSKRAVGAPSVTSIPVTANGPSYRNCHDAGLRDAVSGQLTSYPAARKDENPLAQRREFLDLGRGEDDASPFGREGADEFVDFGLRANIHRRGRRIQQEDPGAGGQPAAKNRLLLVAARERFNRRFD